MPKRQAIDSPTDCVAILANMTAAGEFMTHLSLSIDYTSMRDFCDPRCARTLKTLPLLRVLEIILCPWVAQKVSLGKFNSPDILGLAEELTHVRQVLIANTVVFDDMSVGRKGLWQLAAKLRQRNQNWEANRKLNKVGEHSEATLDDKAQADSDETLDDVARTDSDETLDDVARADTDETVDDVADAEVYIKVEEP